MNLRVVMLFVKKTPSLCISHTSDNANEARNHSPIDTAGEYYNPYNSPAEWV